jgi:hypothetical protein
MTYHIQSVNGRGTSKLKRARHGCEKYWNKYNEPFVRLLKGKFKINKKWLDRKHCSNYE